jgi:hypothetical protein
MTVDLTGLFSAGTTRLRLTTNLEIGYDGVCRQGRRPGDLPSDHEPGGAGLPPSRPRSKGRRLGGASPHRDDRSRRIFLANLLASDEPSSPAPRSRCTLSRRTGGLG